MHHRFWHSRVVLSVQQFLSVNWFVPSLWLSQYRSVWLMSSLLSPWARGDEPAEQVRSHPPLLVAYNRDYGKWMMGLWLDILVGVSRKTRLFLHFCNRCLRFMCGGVGSKEEREENTFPNFCFVFSLSLLLVVSQAKPFYRFFLSKLRMKHLSPGFSVLSYSHTNHVGSCLCKTHNHNARVLSGHQGVAIWLLWCSEQYLHLFLACSGWLMFLGPSFNASQSNFVSFTCSVITILLKQAWLI